MCKLGFEKNTWEALLVLPSEELKLVLSASLVYMEETDTGLSQETFNSFAFKMIKPELDKMLEVKSSRRKAAQTRWEKPEEPKDIIQPSEATEEIEVKKATRAPNGSSTVKTPSGMLTINWDALREQFNDMTGKKTKVVNEKAKRQFMARFRDGHTKEDVMDAIHNCYNDPHHKEHGHKWLTMEFISRPDKFEMYLNAKPVKK